MYLREREGKKENAGEESTKRENEKNICVRENGREIRNKLSFLFSRKSLKCNTSDIFNLSPEEFKPK